MGQTYSFGYRREREIFQEKGITLEEGRLLRAHKRVRWRFKPRSVWNLFTWAVVLFLVCRIVIFPFIEGVTNYLLKTKELTELKLRYKDQNKQLTALKKTRDYMQTHAYVEERGHQMGMVKPNESRIEVVDSLDGEINLEHFHKNKGEIYKY